jgi:hypothetical protein
MCPNRQESEDTSPNRQESEDMCPNRQESDLSTIVYLLMVS